jgi:pre-mRNA cleavage complex 2 protein Pcf11
MDAYLVVEPPIRRKLEEMLQTWKQPVPGSTSSQPVFASEITRKIDNALIKARTAALQHQQKQMRQNQALGLDRAAGRTPPPPHFRNTPPPPMANGSAPYMNGHGYDYGRSASGTPNGNTVGRQKCHSEVPLSYIAVSQPIQNASASVGLQQLSLQGPPPPAGGSVDTLQSDIFRLIDSCQTAVAREPLNLELQKRLQALVDLRKILQTQQLPEAQLVLVRDQVRALANPTPPPAVAAPPPPPQMQLPLSTQDLASLLATATHNMPMSFPAVSQPPPITLPVSLPTAPIIPPPPPPMAGFGANGGMDPASLFASLQKAGLLPNFPGGLPPPPPPPLPSAGVLPFPLPLPGNLPRNIMTPPMHHAAPVGTNLGNKWDWRIIDVEMKSKSLKM